MFLAITKVEKISNSFPILYWLKMEVGGPFKEEIG